ncbi:MAG: DMT family transporter [Pauljensenia sp.]
MKFGVLSGLLWGLDTVVLGIALAMGLFSDAPQAALVGAFLHDAVCMLILLVYMGVRGRLKDTAKAARTASGRVVMVGALLGGPIGMTAYLVAIDNIGPGYTAILSSFYPAVGTVLAVVFLKERMRARQVVALLVALAAIMAMGWSSAGAPTGGSAVLGIVAAVVCMCGWGSEAVLLAWGMRDEMVDNETALQIRETTSALVYGIIIVPLVGAFGFAREAAFTDATGVIAIAALAGTLSYLFYYKAIDLIGAARGMAVNISYSAWAVFFGVFLMGTIPGPLQVVCCIVIIVGTVLSASANWSDLAFWRSAAVASQERASR